MSVCPQTAYHPPPISHTSRLPHSSAEQHMKMKKIKKRTISRRTRGSLHAAVHTTSNTDPTASLPRGYTADRVSKDSTYNSYVPHPPHGCPKPHTPTCVQSLETPTFTHPHTQQPPHITSPTLYAIGLVIRVFSPSVGFQTGPAPSSGPFFRGGLIGSGSLI